MGCRGELPRGVGVRFGERNFLEYAADAVMVSSFFFEKYVCTRKKDMGGGCAHMRMYAYAYNNIYIINYI